MTPTASNTSVGVGCAEQPNPKSTDAAPAINVAPAQRRLKVLVVDDNADAGESLAMLLRIWGHETHTAYDGPAGLQVAEECQPDVVFLDIGLPGMPGYEVAKVLRERFTSKRLVLIALTGYGQEEDRRRTREAGFDEHLLKPAEPLTVKAVLARLQETL